MPEQRMTWKEMIMAYPDRWLAIRDPQMDGPDVISGVVLCAMTDDESDRYMDEHVGEKNHLPQNHGGRLEWIHRLKLYRTGHMK